MKKEQQVDTSKSTDSGLVSFIFGLLSILAALTIPLGFVAGILSGIIGLVFGTIQQRRNKTSWGKWGIVLSIIGILISIAIVIIFSMALAELIRQAESFQSTMQYTNG